VAQPTRFVPSVKRTWGIQQRFFLLQVVLFALLTLILAFVQISSLRASLERDYGIRALNVSRSVALMPNIIKAMDDAHPEHVINPLVNRLRERVNADFIVVGNLAEVRYSHPLPERIGQKMVGGDNEEPLAGREIVSVATGSLGRSIRGKVPLFDLNNKVIGVVSTGFLLPAVQSTFLTVVQNLAPWYGLTLVLALISSSLIARRLKREMFNLEPEQIAALVRQHQATLSAMQEGVLVLDPTGRIQVQNIRAEQMLGACVGIELLVVWQELEIEKMDAMQNQAYRFGNQHLMVTTLEMGEGWWVVTFRDRAEVLEIAQQLTQTQQYVDLLRAQTHEFQNRLHTISGLIQLGQIDTALGIIRHASQRSHNINELLDQLEVPQVAALIVGKYAQELGLQFSLESGSSLPKHWAQLGGESLVLIVGNLLENAFDAALHSKHKRVELMLGTDPDGLQIEVRDSGAGIPDWLEARVFERAVSTKGSGRGYGLSLVRQHVLALGGSLRYFRSEQQTVFQVSFGVETLLEVKP
jgi:two-component system, CitB family, sensor kinase